MATDDLTFEWKTPKSAIGSPYCLVDGWIVARVFTSRGKRAWWDNRPGTTYSFNHYNEAYDVALSATTLDEAKAEVEARLRAFAEMKRKEVAA